jgi:hypothetical protein
MMVTDPGSPRERAEQYVSLYLTGEKLKSSLGNGTDGAVWSTTNNVALKAFHKERLYLKERNAYERLAECDVVDHIEGFSVPEMLRYDDDLLVVEMDLMEEPPYIIDFAKVRIDFPPDFSEETMADSEVRGLERFGPNWSKVKDLMSALEDCGIYYLDPSPYNIVFPEEGNY